MKNNKHTIEHIFTFLTSAEKLKATLRHAYTSDSTRIESSAEHSWMLCLLAMTLFEHLNISVNQLTVMKMLILHDLAEALTGDIPAFEKSHRQDNKKHTELLAMKTLTQTLPTKTQKEFLTVWNEYEENKTLEAKLAQAIDKMEAVMQHNLSDIALWDQNDFDIHPFYKSAYADIDPFLRETRDEIEHISRKKITTAKKLSSITPHFREIYEKLNKNDETT